MVPDDFEGIVYDVGGGLFDHHSEPRETRPLSLIHILQGGVRETVKDMQIVTIYSV